MNYDIVIKVAIILLFYGSKVNYNDNHQTQMRSSMKKTLSIALSALLIFSLCSCSDKNTVEPVETIPEQEIKLVNHMTEAELAGVNKHSLTLLDEPVVTDPLEAFNNSEHTLQIEYRKYTKADLMAGLEAYRRRTISDRLIITTVWKTITQSLSPNIICWTVRYYLICRSFPSRTMAEV